MVCIIAFAGLLVGSTQAEEDLNLPPNEIQQLKQSAKRLIENLYYLRKDQILELISEDIGWSAYDSSYSKARFGEIFKDYFYEPVDENTLKACQKGKGNLFVSLYALYDIYQENIEIYLSSVPKHENYYGVGFSGTQKIKYQKYPCEFMTLPITFKKVGDQFFWVGM